MKHEQQKEQPYLAARSSEAAPESRQSALTPVAYRWRQYMGEQFPPDRHVWKFATHWSTGPKDTQEALYSEAQVSALRQSHAELLEAAKEALEELYRVSPSRAAPKLRAAIAKSEAAS
jgi:hypothetical protein